MLGRKKGKEKFSESVVRPQYQHPPEPAKPRSPQGNGVGLEGAGGRKKGKKRTGPTVASKGGGRLWLFFRVMIA